MRPAGMRDRNRIKSRKAFITQSQDAKNKLCPYGMFFWLPMAGPKPDLKLPMLRRRSLLNRLLSARPFGIGERPAEATAGEDAGVAQG
jgi:hypothetical protein